LGSGISPAAECQPSIGLDRGVRPPTAGTGTLVVRVRRFGTREPVTFVRLRLTRLGEPNPAVDSVAHDPDSTGFPVASLPTGRYALVVLSIGYFSRTDTLLVRAGAIDTVTLGLEVHLDGYRNRHNCRPRRFRRPGESACLLEPDAAETLLAKARRLAAPEARRRFGLPAFNAEEVVLVQDEGICEGASRAYGAPGDPPRRVLVVRLGSLYLVYDPHEPQYAGEFDYYTIFDRDWRVVTGWAG
jgi:hypothetical protein